MRTRTVTVLSVFLILIGAVSVGLYAQGRTARDKEAKPQPVPVRTYTRAKAVKQPKQPAQPTRVQIDLFDLACTTDRLTKLDAEKIGANRASGAEVLKRLGEVGDAKHLIRVDTVVDLTEESSITHGKRRPVVKDMNVSKSGQATPGVDYEEVGFIAEFRGNWQDCDAGVRADVQFDIELSDVIEGGVDIAHKVKLPAFKELKFDHAMRLANEIPVVLLSSDLPIEIDGKPTTHVTVIRLVFTRLPN